MKYKKIITIILILIILISAFVNKVQAKAQINEAYLYKVADCTTKLDYFSKKQNRWINVICYYTEYDDGVNKHPAYCLNADFDGVGEAGAYTVDVAEVIGREDIWRAIINGYPYKTVEQLGVDNVLDAYMITKRAVHSLLYDVDVHSQYRAYDEHGEYIIDKIEALTNIGRYGTQTRENVKLNITESGEIYEDGEYYVQQFNVSSNIQMTDYIVAKTKNMPSGAIITNANGMQTNNFVSGESFFVKIPKDSMISNINAVISVQAKCKTYPVYYRRN